VFAKENLILQMLKKCEIKNIIRIGMINFWLNSNSFVRNLLLAIQLSYRFTILIFKPSE
jgi:hypothetical protein